MAYYENSSACKLLVTLFLVLSANRTHFVKCQAEAPGPSAHNNIATSVPAMFVFGDSLVDNGNNNLLASFAKANYAPYGVDFPNGTPTGRFTNGLTMVDVIANLLGLPLIPPYAAVSDYTDGMRFGVNYASAAAGILDNTGLNFIGRIAFNKQIDNFEATAKDIINIIGASDAAEAFSKSLFFVGMGSNDYLNNYLMPNYYTREQYKIPQQYADFLIQQYTQQLTRLYKLGARKFVIGGLGLMGCIPSYTSRRSDGKCDDEVNQLVQPFNANLKVMINNLSTNLSGTKFSYVDINNMFEDMMVNAQSYGFIEFADGCCGIGKNHGQVTCLPFEPPCLDRNKHIFWDAFHPTEAVHKLFGQRAFNGSTKFVYPNNIQQLASL